jgi:hypothetical protein
MFEKNKSGDVRKTTCQTKWKLSITINHVIAIIPK